jgi:hypothetical protein
MVVVRSMKQIPFGYPRVRLSCAAKERRASRWFMRGSGCQVSQNPHPNVAKDATLGWGTQFTVIGCFSACSRACGAGKKVKVKGGGQSLP